MCVSWKTMTWSLLRSVGQWINESRNDGVTEPLNQWTLQPMNQWMKKLGQLHLPSFLRFLCGTELSLQYRVYVASFIVHQAPIPSFFAIFQCKANALKCTRRSRCSLVHILATSSSKSVSIPSVFCDFYVKLSSRYSLVYIFPASSSKSTPNTSVFTDFCAQIVLSSQSCTHFADLIFQKCSEWQRSFPYSPVRSFSKNAPRLSVFEHFEVEIELSLQSCAFLSATFPDRRLQPRKQRPYFGDHGSHFTQQKHVSRPRVFPPVNARVPELSLFPTPWWWVVDMMRHEHDERQPLDIRPQLGSFRTKFPLAKLPLTSFDHVFMFTRTTGTGIEIGVGTAGRSMAWLWKWRRQLLQNFFEAQREPEETKGPKENDKKWKNEREWEEGRGTRGAEEIGQEDRKQGKNQCWLC